MRNFYAMVSRSQRSARSIARLEDPCTIAAPGFSTLVVFLLFSNGLVFLYLGILGEYLGQMFLEIKGRPSFIIERTVNLDREIPSP